MKQNVQQFNTALMLILCVFLTTGIVACGSGGDKTAPETGGQTETVGDTGTGGKTGTPGETGTISGSVSGTTIIAVNESGDIVASDDTTGKTPDVNGNYPFTLIGIPIGQNIRVYLISFGVYPVYFDSNGDSVSDTNVFSLTSSITIDMGFVDTDIEAGRAIPQNNPTDVSDVNAEAENTIIPTAVNEPITAGLSLSELLTNGFSALNDGWVLRARDFFKAAVDSAGNSTTDDADTARIFYALTRIAAIGFDYYSDKNTSDMNRIGDILDRLGCESSDSARANPDAISCPDSLPGDSPTAGELQTFLYSVVRPELEGAIVTLNAVSPLFNKKLTELFEDPTELDYSDVLIISAAIKSNLAHLLIEYAYDLDFDIDAVSSDETLTTEQFLNGNPELLSLVDTENRLYSEILNAANDYITKSLNDLDAGINSIQAESDDQNDDLITFEDMTEDEMTEAKDTIATAQTCLVGPCIVDDNGTPLETSDDTIIDLTYFFGSRGVQDLRDLIPPFSGDDAGFFPDPTFGGVLVRDPTPDVNEDSNEDGIPDILQ